MGNNKRIMLPIDKTKLNRQIRKKTDFNLTEISKGIDQCGNYLTKCMSLGRICEKAADKLQSRYHIKYEDYKADPVEPAKPAEPSKVPVVISWDGLSEIIQSSIQSSIRSAIKDNRKELEDIMTSAFRKALEG